MRIQDIADIIIMTVLVYQLYTWFRKTRALQVVIGLGFLVVLYIVTKNFGLFMTSWILQELGTVIFVLIIVVFQGEIRQALYRFSLMRNFFDRGGDSDTLSLAELAGTVFSLAERRTGALIVFARQEKLDDLLLHGVRLDSLISGQLLVSIFEDGLPLHDGAVIISNGRISEASCHLPLSASSDLPQHLGTRHRAALGLTERSDAVVVVVSEERGEVSLAVGGELVKVASPELLVSQLQRLMETVQPKEVRFSLRQRLVRNFVPKVVTLVLVFTSWLVLTAREGGLQTVNAQVKFRNLPENLALQTGAPEEVEVQLKVLSNLFASSKKLDVAAELDLAKIHEGVNSLQLDSKSFQLPLGVSVVRVNPATLKVVAERKGYRELPLVLHKAGRLPAGVRLRSAQLDPGRVTVEGPESELARLGRIETEPLDLSTIHKSQTVDLKVVQPSPQVRIRRDDPVKVRLVTVPR
jgi:uncharacterized protein (TIGR00159 family)